MNLDRANTAYANIGAAAEAVFSTLADWTRCAASRLTVKWRR